MYRILSAVLLSCIALPLLAQSPQVQVEDIPHADYFHGLSGKIYLPTGTSEYPKSESLNPPVMDLVFPVLEDNREGYSIPLAEAYQEAKASLELVAQRYPEQRDDAKAFVYNVLMFRYITRASEEDQLDMVIVSELTKEMLVLCPQNIRDLLPAMVRLQSEWPREELVKAGQRIIPEANKYFNDQAEWIKLAQEREESEGIFFDPYHLEEQEALRQQIVFLGQWMEKI